MAGARVVLALAVWLAALCAPARTQEHETPAPPTNRWSFAGPFGKFDRGQLQRGFKVYREVCQVCHALKLLAFRNLAEPGGPGFTTAQATAIAAEYQVPGEPNDQGEVKDRPGRLADHRRAICQGRLRLPDVGSRAASRGPQAHRHAGVHLPDRARRAALFHQ